MSKYIVRRILSLVPVLIGVSFVVFIIISMTPGDAVDILLPPDATEAEFEMLREEFGLNKPLLLQYWRYLAGMLRGDLGTSWYTHDSVFVSFVQRLPATAALTLASMLVSIVLAIPLGVFSSLHPGSPADKAFATMSFLGVSMPSFWIGLMLIIVFAVQWRILPSGGSGTPAHLVLPSIVLGINHSAEIMRMTRASMLDIINSDFIRMARSKG
ncbi:MAG: ABC transporter permease, partial [Ruminococcus flavefaciens]